MRGAVLHAPGDVRVEERQDPKPIRPTDAVVRTVATCVCGSDLWSYRGANPLDGPTPIGHEYVGVVEEVGGEVSRIRPGQFVVGSFFASDNTCPNCRHGFQTNCVNREPMGSVGCQAQYIRVPLADGTLVATPEQPDERHVAGLLACSDVMGTGWYAAVAAGVTPGSTAVVVGDGAVGQCAVIAAKELGAERIVIMSRHADRQELARSFGATHVFPERGEEGVARVMELTGGIGADAVMECVGTDESTRQALRSARAGATVGFVGVPHGVTVEGTDLFRLHVGLRGGPAPVRRFLPDLVERVLSDRIDPGRVFDLTLPLEETPAAYRAMDERRAIKTLLLP